MTLVAVAHPNLQIALAVFISKVGDVLQKFCVAVLTNFCVAELTLSAAFNFAAELLSLLSACRSKCLKTGRRFSKTAFGARSVDSS